jgi:hypothetical protein
MEALWTRVRAAQVPLVVSAALLGILLVAVVASASHGPGGTSGLVSLTGSNFEIDTDANLKMDHSSPSIDWASVNETRKEDTLSGPTDESFGQGTKEDTAVPDVVDGSIPPNKSDLLNFGVYLEGSGTNQFLNLFWHRVQEPQGTTNMDFEFNKSSAPSGNGFTPVRTSGDLLIQYDLAQGGTNPQLFVSYWITGVAIPGVYPTGTTAADCEAANKLPCWSEKRNLSASGDAAGSINASAIPSTPTDETDGMQPPGDISPRTFGEAQLDFDKLAGGGCNPFGSAYLKSRSSDSFTSALKDFIPPTALSSSTCGSIKIIKQTNPRGVNQNFDFTSTIPASSTCTADTTPASFTLNDNGNTGKTPGSADPSQNSTGNTESCTNVPAGTYTVTEGADPAGFVFNNFSCTSSGTGTSTTPVSSTTQKNVSITLAGGGSVTCIYTNDQVQTTTTTRQFVFPQDKARITATGGGNLVGNVTFQLFDSLADCTNTPVTDVKFEQTIPVSGAPPQAATTSNYPGNTGGPSGAEIPPYRIIDGQTHYWKVSYDSTNAQADSVSACTETTTVTYAGNDTSNISIP